MKTAISITRLFIVAFAAAVPSTFVPTVAQASLNVSCTVPDLGSIVREVGGSRVTVTVFAGGMDDPHFVEARPSFISQLSKADALAFVGMDLEVGWLPVLVQRAANRNIRPGALGYIDCSQTISPMNLPQGTVNRAMGDVHPYGDPHYLLDPLNGLKVAALLRDRLAALDPAGAKVYADNYANFRNRIGKGLVGDELFGKYADFEKLCLLHETGKLLPFFDERGDSGKLGGWLGIIAPHYGAKVVGDHPMWPYFAKRYGLVIFGDLEPKPGVPPTTGHLKEIVEKVNAQGVKVLLTAPYYDPKFARFVASNTGAPVATIRHTI